MNTDKICPLYGKSRLDTDSNDPIGRLAMTQNIPTTNALIQDLQSQGLAMRRGGAEHMMIHPTERDEDIRRTKDEELKMEVEFLKQLPKKMKHHLVKRLKHLQRTGLIRV